MDQETGIGSLYAEFFRGYGAEIRLICPDFRPNSTYKRSYPRSLTGTRGEGFVEIRETTETLTMRQARTTTHSGPVAAHRPRRYGPVRRVLGAGVAAAQRTSQGHTGN